MLSYALPFENTGWIEHPTCPPESDGPLYPCSPAGIRRAFRSFKPPATRVAGQYYLSYALPSGTRDDLNIRHTDRKPGRLLYL